MTTFNPAIHYPIYASMIATSNASKYSGGDYDISHPALAGLCMGAPMLLICVFIALAIISLILDLGHEDLFLGLASLCLALMLFGFVICTIVEAISYIF